MTKKKFNEIYKNVILQLKNEIDTEKILRVKPFSEDRIFIKYQFVRDKIKKYYMTNPNGNIDRHKIAACIIFAIIKIYPFYVPLHQRLKSFFRKEVYSNDISYINEYVAIYTALSILDNFYEQDKKENCLDCRRHKIYIPDTFSDDYGYVFNMCIELKFRKIRKDFNAMDILSYSNILFLLEYQHPFNNDEIKNDVN